MEEKEVVQPELSEILQIRRDKLSELQEAGRDPFRQVRFDRTHYSTEIKDNFDALENKTVAVAGRIMSKRGMGKAIFCHIQDDRGQIQLYIRADAVSETEFADFRKYDIGDIVGVSGYVFKTKTEEISIHVEKVTLLSKSLLPLPEKFHGLNDTDLRYRQRYVDLIVHPEVRETFKKRSLAIRSIRKYLDDRGYLEVETPVLNTVQGGATARPFKTHHNTLNLDMTLRIATELPLKRLIVGGFDKVYEIGRIFRNEGMDTRHNPEFTTIEFYEAYTNIDGMMDITEGMMRSVAQTVAGTTLLPFGDLQIDMGKPFERITMTDAVKKYAGVDWNEVRTFEDAKKIADEHHLKLEKKHGKGDVLSLLFEEYCEDKLVQPTFVTSHPLEISPLAKKDPDNPELTQRFELYIAGTEYANAFSELNDPIDQRQRFEAQMKMRELGDMEASQMDEDYITALEYGMPPTGGCGIGIDRFTMLLTNNQSIRDVILFPTMKPIE